MKRSTTIVIMLFACGTNVFGATIHVPADQPTIQACIDAALPGDECLVAPGTYNELINFIGKAITLRSSGGRDVTIIDAGPVPDPGTGKPVVRCDSGEGSATVLDGFTVTGGTGDSGFVDPSRLIGGGMFINNSSPTVDNCRFLGNVVSGGAGGMFINNGSPIVTNCNFDANIASGIDGGGGILYNGAGNPVLSDCMFSDNVATISNGGGMITVNAGVATVTGCNFLRNVAGINGGGIYNNNSSPKVTDCFLAENAAPNGGGGGMFSFVNSSPTVTNCTFLHNTAINGAGWLNDQGSPTVTNSAFIGNTATEGGGMFISRSGTAVTNCMFSGNAAVGTGAPTGNGGGMRNSSSSPTVTNCTFTQNTARQGGGLRNDSTSHPLIINSVFWDNLASETGNEIANVSGSTATVSFSDIQGSLFGGSWNTSLGVDGGGNIDADPLFVDADGGDNIVGTVDDDLRLLSGSPAIDAGDNFAVEGCELDLDGNSRRHDDPATTDTGNGSPPVVDMGAYEFGSSPPQDCNANGVPDECEPDCNADGVIDVCDQDCQSNGASDLCEILGGAPDCNLDGTPDECQLINNDCNGNLNPDDCDSDCAGAGLPDDCQAPLAVASGSRYLTITPQPGCSTIPVAIKITSPDLPCVSKFVALSGGWGVLVDFPLLLTPNEWGTLQLSAAAIVPGAQYHVQIDNGTTLSAPVNVTTSVYGDVDGNGVANFADIQMIVTCFQGNNGLLTAADIAGCTPNHTCNFEDIQWAVFAFQAVPFEELCPLPCN